MAATVTASDLQKNFGLWHDRSMQEPVQITKHGRESAYLVSAQTFHDLWASYRRSIDVLDLSDAEMALILAAEIPADRVYEVEVSPDTEALPTPAPQR